MAAGEQGELEAILGHRFARPELLQHALTHASVRHEAQTSQPPAAEPVLDNERLEFLGDAIVGLLIAELLYAGYPELDEGELTRLRAALVSRKHLGQVGGTLRLGQYLRLGKAEERMGGRGKAALLANCMEALIAALYLDAGLAASTAFVERTVYAPYIEELRAELRVHRSIGDYKTALQELLQARRGAQPTYVVKEESGPDHRKRFVVEVRVDRPNQPPLRAEGEGTTKKKAEQEGARWMYERLVEPLAARHAEAPEQTPTPGESSSAASRKAPGRRNLQPATKALKGAAPPRPTSSAEPTARVTS